VTDRVEGSGAAFAGSQLQTQLYVNRRMEQLDDAVRSEFADLVAAMPAGGVPGAGHVLLPAGTRQELIA
jgi:hypothetical protein